MEALGMIETRGLVACIEAADAALKSAFVEIVELRVGAGVGDLVLVMDEGGSARKILGDNKAPIRTIIAGVIDIVNVR